MSGIPRHVYTFGFLSVNLTGCYLIFSSGGEVVQYTEEQIRRVEESIRIRRESEPVELVRAVLPMDNSFKKFRMFFVLID